MLLGSLSACDPDEDNVLGAIDTEPGVLNDEVRFGVLLIDLVAVTQRYSKGRIKKFLNLFLATSFVGIDSAAGRPIRADAQEIVIHSPYRLCLLRRDCDRGRECRPHGRA